MLKDNRGKEGRCYDVSAEFSLRFRAPYFWWSLRRRPLERRILARTVVSRSYAVATSSPSEVTAQGFVD